MHICIFIINSFDYDSRVQLICRDILSSGWELSIIATVGGRMKTFNGVRIYRIPQPVWPIRFRRFIEYNLKAPVIAKKLKADIYHAVDLDTLYSASLAARSAGARVIFETRELYTEQLSLKNRLLVKGFWKVLERRLIKKVDGVVTVNQSIADELSKRYDIKKPLVVMNTAPVVKDCKPVNFRQKYDLSSKFVLIYQGILRPGQGMIRSLKAIAPLDDVSLVIVGDGPYKTEIVKWIKNLNLEKRVKFAGEVLPDELANYTAGADAGLLLIEPLVLNSYLALPQKLFQYIAAGVPPIVSDIPELRRVVDNDKLGLVLQDGQPEKDSETIYEFLQNRLETALKACHNVRYKYCWENEGKKLLELYRSISR